MREAENVVRFPARAPVPRLAPAHLHLEARQAWLDIVELAPRLARDSQSLERAAVLLAHYRETQRLSPSLTVEMDVLLAELRGPTPAAAPARRYRRASRPGGHAPGAQDSAVVLRPVWGQRTAS